MQYIYHTRSGDNLLSVDNELYRYLLKVRRHKLDDKLFFRNLTDNILYSYKIKDITKKELILNLESFEEKVVENSQNIHLAWCVVDTKTIEKELPYLNELGVKKLSFVYSDFSQKNFKLNYEKYQKIIINSSQQCGRSTLIEFEEFSSIDDFLKKYPNSYVFNFSKTLIDSKIYDINTIIIGCEGGFSKRELELFEVSKIVGVSTNLILKSETAITLVASKFLI